MNGRIYTTCSQPHCSTPPLQKKVMRRNEINISDFLLFLYVKNLKMWMRLVLELSIQNLHTPAPLYPSPVLWIRIQIGSVFSNFVDPDPYSKYVSKSVSKKVKIG